MHDSHMATAHQRRTVTGASRIAAGPHSRERGPGQRDRIRFLMESAAYLGLKIDRDMLIDRYLRTAAAA